MRHETRAGKLEVDHSDPRRKKDLIQRYENLFPASRHCNGKEANTWPSKAEWDAGCRFLNPCEETDHGEQIFEDRVTHPLVGITSAGVWRIRVCALNADHLVAERKRRAEGWHLLKNQAFRQVKGNGQEVCELIGKFRQEVELMIPEIAALPGGAGSATKV